ncbi:MAG: hypothetical protein JWR69_645 [Pedosphaera sp.]|nr:hypothetical protein [Pedosphaera sp.]
MIIIFSIAVGALVAGLFYQTGNFRPRVEPEFRGGHATAP